MILSVPMTSLVKIALESYEETRGIAFMLGSGTGIGGKGPRPKGKKDL